jgi:hypothetical protein
MLCGKLDGLLCLSRAGSHWYTEGVRYSSCGHCMQCTFGRHVANTSCYACVVAGEAGQQCGTALCSKRAPGADYAKGAARPGSSGCHLPQASRLHTLHSRALGRTGPVLHIVLRWGLLCLKMVAGWLVFCTAVLLTESSYMWVQSP